MLTAARFGLIQLEITPLKDGYKLIKFRVKPKGIYRKKSEEALPQAEREALKQARQQSLDDTILSQLANLEALFNNVSLISTPDPKKQVVFSFSTSLFDSNMLLRLHAIFSRPNVEIVEAHLPPVLDGRVTCQVTITIPNLLVEQHKTRLTKELRGVPKIRFISAV
jgi:hypothetical protein